MSTGTDLLAAVLAAPDDDASRLVYADFLQEHGDPRGELAVVQCEILRLEREELALTAEYRALLQRAHELERQQWNAFTKTPARGLTVTWDRGLIGSIAGRTFEQLREHWDLVERNPVRSLALAELDLADLRKLAATSVAARLERLVIGTNASVTLDAHVAFSAVRASSKEGRAWDERGFAHELLTPAIVAMHLWPATADALDELVRAAPPRLRELDCGKLDFAGLSFVALTRKPMFGGLKSLSVSMPRPREVLALLEGARALSSLTIRGADPEQPGFAAAFDRTIALHTVETLTLACNSAMLESIDARATKLQSFTDVGKLSRAAVATLAESRLPARLRHLDINSAEPRLPSTPLVNAPFTRLLHLGLGNFGIGTELPDAPASLDTLTDLRLYGCTIAPTIVPRIRERWPTAKIE